MSSVIDIKESDSDLEWLKTGYCPGRTDRQQVDRMIATQRPWEPEANPDKYMVETLLDVGKPESRAGMEKTLMKQLLRNTLALVAAVLPLTLSPSWVLAQGPEDVAIPGPPPASILWVGNSFFYYNNSLHKHFGRLVASSGQGASVRGTSATISGSGLGWHDMESLLRPGGLGGYSFVGDNEIRFNEAGRQYDTAIMMDCSQCPIHPQLQALFHETVRKHSISLVNHGVRPVLFMSWAYKDKPEMTAQLAEQYTRAGKDNDLTVVPAGLAFARVAKNYPDIELYQPDKRHPSLAGTYLAACTVYATLFGKSPEGFAYNAGLEPVVAAALQKAAWRTALDYIGD